MRSRIKVIGGGWGNPRFWGRVIRTYFYLLVTYSKIPDYDLLLVGYPGQFDVFLARILSLLKGRPLGWDVFMSIYLIALERGLGPEAPPDPQGSPSDRKVGLAVAAPVGHRHPGLCPLDADYPRNKGGSFQPGSYRGG